MKEFYYHRKKLRNWAMFSVLLLVVALLLPFDNFLQLVVTTVAKLVALVSALAAFYVYMNPQKLAQIDDEGIIIDHNAKLKWKDVEELEEVRVKGCCCGRDILRFKLKKGVKYPLTIMQKLSSGYQYGAFSIPLYAMTKEDGQKITKEIKKHLSVSSKIKGAVKKVLKAAAGKTLASKNRRKRQNKPMFF